MTENGIAKPELVYLRAVAIQCDTAGDEGIVRQTEPGGRIDAQDLAREAVERLHVRAYADRHN